MCTVRLILRGSVLLLVMLAAGSLVFPVQSADSDLDTQLRTTIALHNLRPLNPGASPPPAQVALGQMLFFDRILSGNRDIACATCHHPALMSGDALPVSIGTGGDGLGAQRGIGAGREFIPRNAPEVFNRGSPEWNSQFWDGRVTGTAQTGFRSPAGDDLPDGLPNVLAVQALFPVTSRDEMRGVAGDLDVFGQPNEMAQIPDDDMPAMWAALMQRLRAIPGYTPLFAAAYPDLPADELGFEHVAQAIAAFEISAFTTLHSPWERYLAGENAALSDTAKRGALLFYGDAGCATCHAGPLLTDQQHYNIAVPQLGPGKGEEAPLDFGRGRETGVPTDTYRFRTPPLHNVAVTGPYMHNGAYRTLEAAVRHHLDPETALRSYDPVEHLPATLQDTCQQDAELLDAMVAGIDAQVQPARPLTDAEVGDILAFLDALTDPAVYTLERFVPEEVPSGLPVDRVRSMDGTVYLPLVVR